MLRQIIKKKLRIVAVRVLDMEFDTEERDKRSPAPPPTHVDASVIPKVVEGSGDTPGPNHKEKIGRSWVSAQLLSGVDPCLIDIRPPNEVVSGILPGAQCMPSQSIQSNTSILPDKDSRVVIYDQTGELGSPEIAAWLREQGWSWARYLEGGFAEWVEQGEPTAVHPSIEDDGIYRIGDEVNLTDGRRAFVLSENDSMVELWSAESEYIGFIPQDQIQQ